MVAKELSVPAFSESEAFVAYIALVLLTCSADYRCLKSSDFYVGLLLISVAFVLFCSVWVLVLWAADEDELI